ncbi:MAG: orotate phosphoribosyltransferase [Cytophagales bacterium]|nr:orotate phosphoribosyltransferase [Cytophagales bacterium]
MNITLFQNDLSREVAQKLLDVEAIKLQPENPFTWASGWKSPIYCDNRVSLSFPETRTEIKDALVCLIQSEYPTVEAIAGVATAGIPQGALVAEALGLPFIYVRSKSKGHGLTNQIEGKVVKGQKVVILEDLVSTGGSSLAAVDALNSAGIDVLGMTAIFSYAFQKAEDNFSNKNVRLVILSDYPTLLSIGNFDDETKELLSAWRESPETWKQ